MFRGVSGLPKGLMGVLGFNGSVCLSELGLRGIVGAAMERNGDLMQGTLDMLVLKVLGRGPKHGYGVAE